ncbi:MAG TPA: hypothetical protein VNQ33_08115 [Acidimicrobiales bacterium]|nr:hypothetical protein [Acidimicrobiales bacterium]
MPTAEPHACPRPHRLRVAALAAVAGLALALAGCGSSGGDETSSTTKAPAETTSTSTPATETTRSVTTTGAPSTTSTTVAPKDLTPEQTAVAFVRALVEGQSAAAYVRDPAVATDAERQLGEMGQAAYDSIALDPVTSQETSGAPDSCAVHDASVSCYVLIDRSSSDSEGVNTLVRVDVATRDLSTVTGPDDPGPEVPAHVISIEVIPS